jgi:hypothetical protein
MIASAWFHVRVTGGALGKKFFLKNSRGKHLRLHPSWILDNKKSLDDQRRDEVRFAQGFAVGHGGRAEGKDKVFATPTLQGGFITNSHFIFCMRRRRFFFSQAAPSPPLDSPTHPRSQSHGREANPSPPPPAHNPSPHPFLSPRLRHMANSMSEPRRAAATARSRSRVPTQS